MNAVFAAQAATKRCSFSAKLRSSPRINGARTGCTSFSSARQGSESRQAESARSGSSGDTAPAPVQAATPEENPRSARRSPVWPLLVRTRPSSLPGRESGQPLEQCSGSFALSVVSEALNTYLSRACAVPRSS